MTRFEKIKQMTAEELGRYLCDKMDDLLNMRKEYVCDICPWTDKCKRGSNGAVGWLKEEVGDEK